MTFKIVFAMILMQTALDDAISKVAVAGTSAIPNPT